MPDIRFIECPQTDLPEADRRKAETDAKEIFKALSLEELLAETLRRVNEKYVVVQPLLEAIVAQPPREAAQTLKDLFLIINPLVAQLPATGEALQPTELVKKMGWREDFMLMLLLKLKAVLGKERLRSLFQFSVLKTFIPFLVVVDTLPDGFELPLHLDPAVWVRVVQEQKNDGDPLIIPEMIDFGAFVRREPVLFQRIADARGMTRTEVDNVLRFLGVKG